MRVMLMGETQTRHIAKLYQAAGHDVFVKVRDKSVSGILKNIVNIFCSDMVYQVYGVDIAQSVYLRLAAFLGKRVIIHWIGTDVLEAADKFQVTKRVMNQRFEHVDLACAEHLRDELEAIGIHAKYIPIIPVDVELSPLPMPSEHAALAYIPESKALFYGMNEIKLLATHYPQIPFYIVANRGDEEKEMYPNIHYMGTLQWEELKELYGKCSVMVRCTRHDGLPVMVLEALGLGRQVLYSFAFPYAHTPADRTPEEILNTAEQIFSVPPKINQEGSDYVNQQFQTQSLMAMYAENELL